jgi:hypothetical protein
LQPGRKKRRRQRFASLAPLYGKLAGYQNHASSRSALRSGSESPRNPHLQALPAMDLRVASNLASFSGAGGESSGRPDSSLLQCHLSMRLRVAPIPASSGCADGESSGCPEASLLQRRLVNLQVAPKLAPSGHAAHASSGCPDSCTRGWVDDDSPAFLELCILSRSRG